MNAPFPPPAPLRPSPRAHLVPVSEPKNLDEMVRAIRAARARMAQFKAPPVAAPAAIAVEPVSDAAWIAAGRRERALRHREMLRRLGHEMVAAGDPAWRRVAFERMRAIRVWVANRYGLSMEILLGPSRAQNVVRVRHLAIQMVAHHRACGALSLPEIARHFGDRDHTTVLHAVRKSAAARNRRLIRPGMAPPGAARAPSASSVAAAHLRARRAMAWVCRRYAISLGELTGPRITSELVLVRRLAMRVVAGDRQCRVLTLGEIGRMFNRSDDPVRKAIAGTAAMRRRRAWRAE